MKQYIFPALAVVALVLGVFSVIPNKTLGGQYNTNHAYFSGVTNSGTLTQTGASTMTDLTVSGTFTPATLEGYVTSSLSALTVSGTATTSALVATGASTLTGSLSANNILNSFGTVASSTIQVGASSKAGCIILGDSANSASPVYIIASGATLTASTTKPTACQTVR